MIMLGREPFRVDILCRIDGITFDEAWESRQIITIDGVAVSAISLDLLVRNKAASGRDKDILDIKTLKKLTHFSES